MQIAAVAAIASASRGPLDASPSSSPPRHHHASQDFYEGRDAESHFAPSSANAPPPPVVPHLATRGGFLATGVAGDMNLGHGATGMSLDFEHQMLQQQQLVRQSGGAAMAASSPSYSYGGVSDGGGFDESPYRSSSVIAGAGAGWAWGIPPAALPLIPPAPLPHHGGGTTVLEIEGRGGGWESERTAAFHHTPVAAAGRSLDGGLSPPPTVGSGSSSAMAYGSPVPGATAGTTSWVGWGGSASQDGPSRGRSRIRTSEGGWWGSHQGTFENWITLSDFSRARSWPSPL